MKETVFPKWQRIDENYTVGEVKNHPAFSDYRAYLLSSASNMKYNLDDVKLKDLKIIAPTWGIQDIIDGLNRLLELEEQKVKVAWDYWDDIDKQGDPKRENTKMLFFPSNKKNMPFALICAGGSYRTVAYMMEAFPVANRLNRLGYSAFVLSYRIGIENVLPDAIEDLAKAVRFVLQHAELFRVQPKDYMIMGFSTGGHLAAEYGTDNFGYMNINLPKPAALVLGYPLISFKYGKNFDSGFAQKSVYKNVSARDIEITEHMSGKYPPVYFWQCVDDEVISIKNTEKLNERLNELDIPHVYKRIQKGGHGLGLGSGSEADGWVEDAVDFWMKQWKI